MRLDSGHHIFIITLTMKLLLESRILGWFVGWLAGWLAKMSVARSDWLHQCTKLSDLSRRARLPCLCHSQTPICVLYASGGALRSLARKLAAAAPVA